MRRRVIIAVVMLLVWSVVSAAMPPYLLKNRADVEWYTGNP